MASTFPDGRGSAGQLRIFTFMKKLYSKYTVLWEQPINTLGARLDIFVKELGIAIEVDGVQHDEFSSFFHKDADGFKKAFKADQAKDDFCEMNGIKLIRLKYKEALQIEIEGLKDRINSVPYPEGDYTYSCLG